jgi:hypothetical protein
MDTILNKNDFEYLFTLNFDTFLNLLYLQNKIKIITKANKFLTTNCKI